MGCCGGGSEDENQQKQNGAAEGGGGEEGDSKKDLGEPFKYDPTFNGPIKNRSCTDVICCLLFIICFLGMICVAGWAYYHGDPMTLLYPTDSSGNLCGSGSYANKPYLFFFDLVDCAMLGPSVIVAGCPTPQICVSECPTKAWTYIMEGMESYTIPVPQASQSNLVCLPDVQDTLGSSEEVCVEACPTSDWTYILEGTNAIFPTVGVPSSIRDNLYCTYTTDLTATADICVESCPTGDWAYIMEGVNAMYPTVGIPSSIQSNVYCKYTTDVTTTSDVCVSECPNTTWSWISQEAFELAHPSLVNESRAESLICKYDANTTTEVCVATCPNTTFTSLQATVDERFLDQIVCKPGVNASVLNLYTLVQNEDCAAYYLESESVGGRCIPTLLTSLPELIMSNGTQIVDMFGAAINGTILADASWLTTLLNAQEYGIQILSDVESSGWLILVFLAIGALLAFVWILLMRWLAGPIVWLTLILFLVVFTFTTYYCFTKYVEIKANSTSIGITDVELSTSLDYYANLYITWLVLGIISAVILFCTLVTLIFLRERIRIAIALIGEGSRAVGCMMLSLLWPIFPFIFQVAIFAFWGLCAVYLASVSDAQYGASNVTYVPTNQSVTYPNGTSTYAMVSSAVIEAISMACDAASTNQTSNGTTWSETVCSFILLGGSEYTIYLQVYQLFMMFWLMNFTVALGQMSLAGGFASYYWAFDKSKDIPAFPLAASLWRCFRYHLGSLAFGSLLIALIQIIRVMLEYLDHKLKKYDNQLVKFLMACLKCCFWCLEKFMRFLNKNAYILIAVYGKNFCTSAKNAFFLILRNIVRVVVIDKVADYLLLLGKLLVTAMTAGIAFYFFSGDLASAIPASSISTYITEYTPSLNFYIVPVIIILLGVYIIAACFFSVYSMAVDTLFLCFLEDLERHDGSPEKPYYMSKTLMNILGLKNRKPGEKEKKKCCGCC